MRAALQLRVTTAWKVHLLGVVTWCIMQADRVVIVDHPVTFSWTWDAVMYLGLALIPVAFVTLSSELRARERFAAHHRMSCEEVGMFWNRCFALSKMLGVALRAPSCLPADQLHQD